MRRGRHKKMRSLYGEKGPRLKKTKKKRVTKNVLEKECSKRSKKKKINKRIQKEGR